MEEIPDYQAAYDDVLDITRVTNAALNPTEPAVIGSIS